MPFDPDAYLAAKPAPKGGFDPDAYLAGGKTEKPSTWMDAAKSFGSGILQNLNGFLGDGGPLQTSEADPQFAQTHLPAAEVMSAVPGSSYKPQTGVGQYAQTAGQLAPMAFGGEASIPVRALTRVLLPAAGGEIASKMAAGSGYEGAAKVAGEVLGGSPVGAAAVAPIVARASAKALATRLAESLPTADAALVSKYEAMGGHLRPSQYSPSNFMRQGDSVISDTAWPRASGFAADSKTAVLPAQQSDEFNRFLSRTFGEDAPRITDDVVQQAQTRIGKVYEDVLPRNSVASDQHILDGFAKVENDIAEAAPAMKPEDVTRMGAVMNRIKGQLADGGITGKQYQTYRQRGGILDELAGSDSPVLQNAAKEIRNQLDDAFIRQASPEDGAALLAAKQQYRNLETLKPLAAKAPAGNISPGLVLGVVNKEFGSPANAGDLGTLARVGSAFLKSQPSSGTAERTIWRSLVNKPFSEGVPAIANSAISLPVSALASRQLNRVINSPEMRARLLANALKDQGATAVAGQPDAAALALARALKR